MRKRLLYHKHNKKDAVKLCLNGRQEAGRRQALSSAHAG